MGHPVSARRPRPRTRPRPGRRHGPRPDLAAGGRAAPGAGAPQAAFLGAEALPRGLFARRSRLDDTARRCWAALEERDPGTAVLVVVLPEIDLPDVCLPRKEAQLAFPDREVAFGE